MTENERIALNLLRSFNCAILRRLAPKTYVAFGQTPEFYNTLFPHDDDLRNTDCANHCTAPWAHSPMLEFFLDEAEAFFESGETGSITSGVWEEDGTELTNSTLIANAVSLDDAQLLVIRLLNEDHARWVGILQKARLQLLENRQLSHNLALFKEKSQIDGLTHTLNRTAFMELLHDEIKRSQILEYPLVLLILDIDDFKKVNDTYGHLTGDVVLRGLSAALKQSLRRNDLVARYGGEEFAVLIPHETTELAAQVAEKIRNNIEALRLPDAPPVTVSIGCTAYEPGENPENFFKRSDEALYAAKREGKNRVCVK